MSERLNPMLLDDHILLTPGEALLLLRFSRDIEAANRTASNMLCKHARNPFPLPVVEILGKKRVRRADVLKAMGIESPVLPAQALNKAAGKAQI